jgi:hypothetical protein
VENKPALWPEPKLYYVQDTRRYCGDSVFWWRVNGQGYTTNLVEAMKVDASWIGRETDHLWSCEYVDKYATRQLDSQKLRLITEEEQHAK